MQKTPKVSVIVPTFNEEGNIEACLKSVLNQSYKNIEVIVVDSLLTRDKTAELARKYTEKVYRFGEERSSQRNFGVKKATGEYLLIIDSDMKLSKEVVKKCVNVTEKKGIVAVIIPEKSYGSSYWAKCKALEKNCYIGDDDIEAPRFFRRESYLEVGGFDDDMISGEDWDLGKRISKMGKISRIQSFIYHNEGDLTLVDDLRKKLYYAKKSTPYIEKHVNGLGDVVRFIFRPALFRNWRMLISDPIHLIGLMVMKVLEIAVGGFGAIIYKRSFLKKLTRL